MRVRVRLRVLVRVCSVIVLFFTKQLICIATIK